MLTYLKINNFLLIDNLEVEFSDKLNVFTGETGVGKTVLVNVLKLLSGDERIKKNLTNKNYIDIQAVFDIKNNKEKKELLNSLGFEGELIVRVNSGPTGRFKYFINNTLVNKKIFDKIMEGIFDIHSQHENQTLLKTENQQLLYDNFIGLQKDLENFKDLYSEYMELKNKIENLEKEREDIQKEYDFIKFQHDEIERVSPKIGEEEELKEKLNIAKNYYKIKVNVESSIGLISESDFSISNQMAQLISNLEFLSQINEEFKNYLTDIKNFQDGLFDLLRSLEKLRKDDVSEMDIDTIQERLSNIEKLHKYGETIEEILTYQKSLKEKLSLFDASNFDIKKLRNELKTTRKELIKEALNLRKKRKDAKKEFEEKVKNELHKVAMEGVDFQVKIKENPEDSDSFLKSTGFDEIEFLIDTTNRGLFPLTTIASGGELSRIMLVLKELYAQNDNTETLVFDEIDVGIGGETAISVGEKIQNIARHKQIIAITHLHQIAKFADFHFKVEKIEKNSVKSTKITLLNDKERIKEIARMLGGEKISNRTLKLAEEILQNDHTS